MFFYLFDRASLRSAGYAWFVMSNDSFSNVAPEERFLDEEPVCATCPTFQQAEWQALGPELQRRISSSKVYMQIAAGKTVFHQNSPASGVHCVRRGSIAMRRSDAHGNSRISRLIESGQTLGYRALFAGTVYEASAETLTPCQVCFIPKATVSELLTESPELSARFLQRLAGDLGDSELNGFRTTFLRIRTRLAHLILAMRGRHGTVDDDGNIIIEPPLSRQDMAALIGARAESLSRAIRALQDDGVAKFGRRRIVVHDLDNLLDEIDEHI